MCFQKFLGLTVDNLVNKANANVLYEHVAMQVDKLI